MSLEKTKLLVDQIIELTYKNDTSRIKGLTKTIKEDIIRERKEYV